MTDGTAHGPAASARPCFLRWALGHGVLRQQERGATKRRALGVQLRLGTIADESSGFARHDSLALAASLLQLYREESPTRRYEG